MWLLEQTKGFIEVLGRGVEVAAAVPRPLFTKSGYVFQSPRWPRSRGCTSGIGGPISGNASRSYPPPDLYGEMAGASVCLSLRPITFHTFQMNTRTAKPLPARTARPN